MIPATKQVGEYIVVTSPEIGMSTVQQAGLLVPVEVKSFHVGQDAVDIEDAYNKAVEFAENL